MTLSAYILIDIAKHCKYHTGIPRRKGKPMKICCELDREIAEAFEAALAINKESVEDVMRNAVLAYIKKTKVAEKCRVLPKH